LRCDALAPLLHYRVAVMRIPLTRMNGDTSPIAWWENLFLPLVFLVLMIAAVASVPYFWLYPERHATGWDFDGNPCHEHRLRSWRSTYARLSLAGRVRRSWRKRRRRGRI